MRGIHDGIFVGIKLQTNEKEETLTKKHNFLMIF